MRTRYSYELDRIVRLAGALIIAGGRTPTQIAAEAVAQYEEIKKVYTKQQELPEGWLDGAYR